MIPAASRFTRAEAIEYVGKGSRAGWYGRLSAPGYLDCTEWSGPYKTEEEALLEVCDTYDVDLDGNDPESPDYSDPHILTCATCGGIVDSPSVTCPNCELG
jgi:hypothetical protein